jgi:hypothetical protein
VHQEQPAADADDPTAESHRATAVLTEVQATKARWPKVVREVLEDAEVLGDRRPAAAHWTLPLPERESPLHRVRSYRPTALTRHLLMVCRPAGLQSDDEL